MNECPNKRVIYEFVLQRVHEVCTVKSVTLSISVSLDDENTGHRVIRFGFGLTDRVW